MSIHKGNHTFIGFNEFYKVTVILKVKVTLRKDRKVRENNNPSSCSNPIGITCHKTTQDCGTRNARQQHEKRFDRVPVSVQLDVSHIKRKRIDKQKDPQGRQTPTALYQEHTGEQGKRSDRKIPDQLVP
jgi:hypothetical protein